MIAEIHFDHILGGEALAEALAPLRRDYGAVVLLTAAWLNAERRQALRGRQEAYIAALAACLRATDDDAASQLYGRTPRRRS